MDANEYACKVQPADKSLALLMNAAQWWVLAHGHQLRTAPPGAVGQDTPARAMVVDEADRRAVAHRG
jgi:hypothetical protein